MRRHHRVVGGCAGRYRGLVATKLTVTAGVVVRADQKRVWDLVVDWPRQREWILATVTEGGHGIGAKVTGRTGFGRLRFADPMEITEWVPPCRCTVTHLGKVVRGSGVFEVRPRQDADGCELRWSEAIELPVQLPPALARLVAAALIGPITRVGLGWSLRRFARLFGPRTRADRRSAAGGHRAS
jgi:hypothetical protein